MSIWSSLSDGIEVPARDNYSGELTTERTKSFKAMTVDVARAWSWHDCVRLSVYSSNGDDWAETLMSPDEIRALIVLLEQAIA